MSDQRNLHTLIDFASDKIEVRFKQHGEIYPMWHAFTRDGDQLVIPAQSPDKDTEAAIMRALFELRDVVRYVFINEAWMLDARNDPEKITQAVRKGRVSDHPDRVEVIWFSAEDEVEGMVQARRFIIRPENDKPTLGPLEYLPVEGLSSGRFVGMLPRRGTMQ